MGIILLSPELCHAGQKSEDCRQGKDHYPSITERALEKYKSTLATDNLIPFLPWTTSDSIYKFFAVRICREQTCQDLTR